jgi:hypothetical protein
MILIENNVIRFMIPNKRIITLLILFNFSKKMDKKITPKPIITTRRYDAKIIEYVLVLWISAKRMDLININQVGRIIRPMIKYSCIPNMGCSKKMSLIKNAAKYVSSDRITSKTPRVLFICCSLSLIII